MNENLFKFAIFSFQHSIDDSVQRPHVYGLKGGTCLARAFAHQPGDWHEEQEDRGASPSWGEQTPQVLWSDAKMPPQVYVWLPGLQLTVLISKALEFSPSAV